MQPLAVIQSDHNSLLVNLAGDDHLTVFPPFIGSGQFVVKPIASGDLLPARVLSGRLMECHFATTGDERTVQLHGLEANGRFLVVRVDEGEKMFLRFPALAAYRLGPGGRFASARKLTSPVRWYTGTAFAIVAVGPVDLVLYGTNLVSTESRERLTCFAHHLVAFDARTTFHIRGLRPEGHVGTWLDALSNVVEVAFEGATPVVRRTTGDGSGVGVRIRQVVSMVFGTFIGGSIFEHLLVSPWLWSLIL